MQRAQADLERLVPTLLAVWRARRGGGRARPGRRGATPPDRLAPDELREVAAGVTRLSQGLTRERTLAGARYLDDPRLLGAYLLFYWPVSYLQARGVLSELRAAPGDALDLGSGPGPVAYAALDAGARSALAADRSGPALAVARALGQATRARLDTAPWDPTRPGALARLAAGRTYDLVTMGHVLNELFREGAPGASPHTPAGGGERGGGASGADPATAARTALLVEAAALLRPGGSLVVIEPALRETSRALLAVRDGLVAGGFALRAPCLFTGPCPARLRETDWCHAERAIEPPPLVAEIGRAAGLRKEAVKMSYLVVAPRGEGWAPPPSGEVFRVVSEPLAGKGRLRYMACGPAGRMGLSLQEKHVNDGNRAFEHLLRGDVVRLAGTEPRGDGLRLGPEGRVEVIAPAGAPVGADER